jgi:hypothetical protein
MIHTKRYQVLPLYATVPFPAACLHSYALARVKFKYDFTSIGDSRHARPNNIDISVEAEAALGIEGQIK